MDYNNSLDLEDSDSNDKTVLGMAPLKEQERFLPIANIAKIMKKAIPSDNGKIAKDARECIQECVSEFISFITSEASERCQSEKRKTMNGNDVIFALYTLGFENYTDPLKVFLEKYRESTKTDKNPELSGDELNDFVSASNNGQVQTSENNVLYSWTSPI